MMVGNVLFFYLIINILLLVERPNSALTKATSAMNSYLYLKYKKVMYLYQSYAAAP